MAKKAKPKYIVRIVGFYTNGADAFVMRKDKATGVIRTPDIGKAREFATEVAANAYIASHGLNTVKPCKVEPREGVYL